MQFLDSAVASWVLSLRSLSGIMFFGTVTNLAGDVWVIVFCVVIPYIWWHRGLRAYAEGIWISVAGAEITSYLLKLIVARERPEGALMHESTYSFPSGHAVVAVALYGFLLWVLWREVRTRKIRIGAGSLLIAIILGIGFSRLYLGVHYLSDVVAGYLVGMLWLSIAIFYTRKKIPKR